MIQHIYFFKEIKEFYRFFRKEPVAKKRRIVFYSEHGNYYPYFEGLINELISKYNQVIYYVTSDIDDWIWHIQEPKIKTFYFNKLLPFFMAFVNCKVFVMTMPDLNQFHLRRSINPVHYVYVFHAMVSTHMMYREGAFDHYDSILCVGPHQVREIRRRENLYNLPPKKLVKAGYYRLERLYSKYRLYKRTFSSNKKKQRTILIAPSWGSSNILKCCGEELIDILLRFGYRVIVRPHPETVNRSPGLISLLSSKFGNEPNFLLERSIVTDTSLLEADVLICDCSGIALEYAFGTERPVLFLDLPPKIRNQRFEELGIEPLELSIRSKIGRVISPKKLTIVPQVISDLIANRMFYKKNIVELRNKYVYAFGHSSEIGARYIIDLIKSSRVKPSK